MTYGSCRITFSNETGRPYIADVNEVDLWYFRRLAASVQGLGPDGCEFLIVFDDGHASEFSTLLNDGMVHPYAPNILARIRSSG